LPRHPNRMLTLLGKASIVDDPRLDGAVPFQLRQEASALIFPLTHAPHCSNLGFILVESAMRRLL
jgi:hypothetical protein